MSTPLDAADIARLSLHNPSRFDIQHSQTLHRQTLVREWQITAGAKVLELGCGQGDCTTVLADAVGPEGKVIAVDPASLDYGTLPLPLSSHIPTCDRRPIVSAPLTRDKQAPHTPSAKPRATFPKVPSATE